MSRSHGSLISDEIAREHSIEDLQVLSDSMLFIGWMTEEISNKSLAQVGPPIRPARDIAGNL